MSRKRKKAPLSYKEAWERKIRVKENIAIVIGVISLIIAVVALIVT